MPNYDFKNFGPLLTRAGITVAEAAKIFRTSRPTIYHWCKGNAPTQPIVLSFATRMIRILETAVNAKDLPLKDVEKEERAAAIDAVFKKYLVDRRAG